MKTSILKVLYRIRQSLKEDQEENLYFIGFQFFLLSLPVSVIEIILQKLGISLNMVTICFHISALVMFGGFSYGVIKYSKTLWNQRLGKVIITFIFTLAIQVSYIVSQHEINNITNLPPEYFENATILFTVLTTPLIIFGFLSIAFIITIVVFLLGFIGELLNNLINYFIKNYKIMAVYRYFFKSRKSEAYEVVIILRTIGAMVSMWYVFLIYSVYVELNYSNDYFNNLKKIALIEIDYYRSS